MPAFEKHFLDFTQTEAEAVIEPDGVGDDFDRVAMVLVCRVLVHTARLPPTA